MTPRTNSSTGSRSFRSPRTSSGFTRVRHTCLSKASIVRPWPTNSPPLASPVFQVGWFNSVTSISKRSSTLSLFSSAWQPYEGLTAPLSEIPVHVDDDVDRRRGDVLGRKRPRFRQRQDRVVRSHLPWREAERRRSEERR